VLFSLSWLRELCPVPGTEREIADRLTARGLTVDAIEVHGDDAALDVDVPANRPDCLGHLGLARELAAAHGLPLAPEPRAPEGTGSPLSGELRVEIDDAAACPRYTARLVRGVRVGPSPPWVRRRLELCGLRSINTVVDASNLVLLELGHPIHFFDWDRWRDGASGPGALRVRFARAGETLVTLDGAERRLGPEDLVIADERRPRALAGVIGGADSGIGDDTRDVLIEAAAFAPRRVRATARRLGLATDASSRFERGVDAAGAERAQARAVGLLAELAGGRPAPGMLDAAPVAPTPRRLALSTERLARLLGYRPEDDETLGALTRLGLEPRRQDGSRIGVTVPSHRPDLEREADLIEEVARHLGYDRIPAIAPPLVLAAPSDERRRLASRARDRLAAAGFLEAFGYSMIAAGADADFVQPRTPPPLALTNPIAEPLAVLRRSLAPGLLRAVDSNLRHGTLDVRLFEIGHVFVARGPGLPPDEPLHAAIAWSGAARPRHRGRARRGARRRAGPRRDRAPRGRRAAGAPSRPGHALAHRGG
jgi:phenylalanyl-tRNA synthetase beta chain